MPSPSILVVIESLAASAATVAQSFNPVITPSPSGSLGGFTVHPASDSYNPTTASGGGLGFCSPGAAAGYAIGGMLISASLGVLACTGIAFIAVRFEHWRKQRHERLTTLEDQGPLLQATPPPETGGSGYTPVELVLADQTRDR